MIQIRNTLSMEIFDVYNKKSFSFTWWYQKIQKILTSSRKRFGISAGNVWPDRKVGRTVAATGSLLCSTSSATGRCCKEPSPCNAHASTVKARLFQQGFYYVNNLQVEALKTLSKVFYSVLTFFETLVLNHQVLYTHIWSDFKFSHITQTFPI
jgi:hypothetical protein